MICVVWIREPISRTISKIAFTLHIGSALVRHGTDSFLPDYDSTIRKFDGAIKTTLITQAVAWPTVRAFTVPAARIIS